ncbi:MAG: DUF4249 domain-containing protein [Bacteroidota bacterium]
MKTLIYSLFIVVCIGCMSCEKMAQDVTPPKVESQLVVFSFLSPEEKLVKVEVSKSKPVYGNAGGGSNIVSSATVTITNDGGLSVEVPYVDSLSAYAVAQSAYSIEPGRTYTVNVQAGGKTASGRCTVPQDSLSFSAVTFLSISQPSVGYDGPYFIYNYKWQDAAGQKNYYRVDVEKIYTYQYNGDTSETSENVCNSIWDDENKDGGILNGKCEDYSWQSDGSDVRVYLLNTDIHYYEYHRRRLNYYGDNPFSEPFQQYNNVQGGLGVVSAYRITSRMLKVN